MIEKRVNFVTFDPVDDNGDPAGERIFLKLDADWVVTGGIEPNVNSAVVPWTEFDKIKDNLTQRGRISFWSNSDPRVGAEQPDHFIPENKVVDIDAVEVRQPHGQGAARVTEYRLYFADIREIFVAPRGGILNAGVVNPEPANGAILKQNSELIQDCLTAMGIPFGGGIDPGVDDLQPIRKLDWSGNHAPTELAKILAHCSAVYCMDENGSHRIWQIGNGPTPNIPSSDLLDTLTVPGLDRRGKTVIITSAPTAITHTISADGAAVAAQYWQFVAQDSKGKWQRIDDGSNNLVTGDPAQMIRDGTAPLGLRKQMYYCLRLDPEANDPALSRVLRSSIDKDGVIKDIVVEANIAVFVAVGTWANGTARLRVRMLDQEHNVIQLDERLGKIDPALAGPDGRVNNAEDHFAELEDGDVKIEYSVEAWDKEKNRKEFFNAGFQLDAGGGITDLDAGAVELAINGGGEDVTIYPVPQLRLVRMDDETPGSEAARPALVDEARGIAKGLLAGSGQPFEIRVARGFVPGVCSGYVSEIRYSQQQLTTTFKLNTWWTPIGALKKEDLNTPDAAEAIPQQQRTSSGKLQLGESSSAQPSIPAGATLQVEPRRREVCVVPERAEGGRGIYSGFTLSQKLNVTAGSDLSLNTLVEKFGGEKVLIVNALELGQPDTFKPKHVVPIGVPIDGFFCNKGAGDQRQIVLVFYDPLAFRAFRIADDPSDSKKRMFQGAHVTAEVATEEDWVTIFPIKVCAPGS
jgi:hypothetical protein